MPTILEQLCNHIASGTESDAVSCCCDPYRERWWLASQTRKELQCVPHPSTTGCIFASQMKNESRVYMNNEWTKGCLSVHIWSIINSVLVLLLKSNYSLRWRPTTYSRPGPGQWFLVVTCATEWCSLAWWLFVLRFSFVLQVALVFKDVRDWWEQTVFLYKTGECGCSMLRYVRPVHWWDNNACTWYAAFVAADTLALVSLYVLFCMYLGEKRWLSTSQVFVFFYCFFSIRPSLMVSKKIPVKFINPIFFYCLI